MEIWRLGETKRRALLDETLKLLDQWEDEGTETLQEFLGIPIAGWVYYLREGINGQSDDQLRNILRHIYLTGRSN